MDSMYMLLDVLIFGCGAYALYQWILLKRAGELLESKMLYPNNCGPQNCKDPEGYYKFIMPHYLVFSLAALICGALCVLNDFVTIFTPLVGAILNGLFLVVIIYYIVVMKRGHSRYF